MPPGHGHRPPWWPEGEPFPPARGRHWGRDPGSAYAMRGAIFGCLLIFVVPLLFIVLLGPAFLVLSHGFITPVGWSDFLLVFAIIVGGGLGLALVGRRFRQTARPVRDLVEAATRVGSGDYSVRVMERGPRPVRRAARAFNAMTEQLGRVDAQRKSVIADVAHELRTPLSVIRGQAEGIADGIYTADAEHVAPILEATRTMESLVEDLRTMVLTDAGSLTLTYEPIDLDVLLNETVRAGTGAAAQHGVALKTSFASDLAVDGDALRLRSVFGNLISNAVRHTPPGGSVTVSAVEMRGGVEVTVSDTGEGIPPELQPRVFERFVKGENSSGSGLGLAIAKDLVEAHGGAIGLDSAPGKGTAVRVWLPGDRA